MSQLTILRSYAQKSDPAKLPASVLFSHTGKFLTIFDAYPKAIFHFLVLPRLHGFNSHAPKSVKEKNLDDSSVPISHDNAESPPLGFTAGTKETVPTKALTVFDLANLRSLLKHSRARDVLTTMKVEAAALREKIEEEMVQRYGSKWDVWMGFHAVPSMVHLHLHVISSDLCSATLKSKKHYNSFHPKEGFFLHLDQVLEWLDTEPSYFTSVSKLPASQYEPILKRPLACWRCGEEMRNMPALKEHLQTEWNKEAEREKAKTKSSLSRLSEAAGRKRKRDPDTTDPPSGSSSPRRRKASEEPAAQD